jgi:hypothetical protein
MSTKFFDLLNPEQKGQIKKASSQRLFKWLVDAGMSEDEAEKLTREQLMEAWAEALSSGKDIKKPVAMAGVAGKYGYDPDLERERLEFEKEKWNVEVKLQRKKEEKEKSVVYQAKLFGDALRGSMNKMPQDAVELTTRPFSLLSTRSSTEGSSSQVAFTSSSLLSARFSVTEETYKALCLCSLCITSEFNINGCVAVAQTAHTISVLTGTSTRDTLNFT